MEYDSFGFYLSMHPVQKYRNNNITTNDIKSYFNKTIYCKKILDNSNIFNYL